jgi:uncharacterized membrane protein
MKQDGWADAATRFYAVMLMALGVLGLITGDFAMVWQDVPKWVPGRTALAYACAAFELLCGVGIFLRGTRARVAPVLQVYMLLWLILLRLPPVAAAPAVEGNWLGVGETSILLAGALAVRTEADGVWLARARYLAPYVFGLAVLPCGLAHIVYLKETAGFIPAFLGAPKMWALITGIGYLAAGAAVLLKVVDRLAATLTAVMMGFITLLVWGPAVLAKPYDRMSWTALIISALLWAGACTVAEALRGKAWWSLPWSAKSATESGMA